MTGRGARTDDVGDRNGNRYRFVRIRRQTREIRFQIKLKFLLAGHSRGMGRGAASFALMETMRRRQIGTFLGRRSTSFGQFDIRRILAVTVMVLLLRIAHFFDRQAVQKWTCIT